MAALDSAASSESLTVLVKRGEFLGDAYRVHCDWNGIRLLVETAEEPPSGEVVVRDDPADVQVFES